MMMAKKLMVALKSSGDKEFFEGEEVFYNVNQNGVLWVGGNNERDLALFADGTWAYVRELPDVAKQLTNIVKEQITRYGLSD